MNLTDVSLKKLILVNSTIRHEETQRKFIEVERKGLQ